MAVFCQIHTGEFGMKRVLVTGGTGFIGRHSIPLLLELGYEVHATTSKNTEKSRFGVTWHQTNLLDCSQISGLLNRVKPTHLLHFAWYLVPGQWATVGAEQNFCWAQSTLELFRCFKEQGGVRAVSAGSCTEYDWNYGYCSENRTPISPNTFYGRSKASVYEYSTAYLNEVKISNAWGRIFFVYGKYEHPSRLVSSVIRSLLSNEPALCTHGNQIRDFLFSEDVADAFVALLESDLQGAVNVASGHPVSLRGLVNKVAQSLSAENLVQFGAIPAPPNETPFVIGDTKRLTEELGWSPKYDLDSGLRETIEWWKQCFSEATH